MKVYVLTDMECVAGMVNFIDYCRPESSKYYEHGRELTTLEVNAAVEGLIDHPDVSVVGFVGSTAIARAVYSRAAGLGKRALALGGANNPVIVVPDADPVVTAPGVVSSFTGCAGQRCMAAANLIAVGDVDHNRRGLCHSTVPIATPTMAQTRC